MSRTAQSIPVDRLPEECTMPSCVKTRHLMSASLIHVRKQLADLREYMGDLEHAVITVDGHRMTMWNAYEHGDYEPLCTVCRDVDCQSEHEGSLT